MKKYYKLLTKRPDGKLASFLMSDLRNQWTIIYEPKVWTFPKTGKIFIFTSLKAIKEFSGSWGCHPLWQCQAKGVEWIPGDFPRSAMYHREWFRNWELFNLGEMGDKESQNKHQFPWGTLIADKIKLIKQVYP